VNSHVSAETLTHFDGVLITIHSDKSFFEATKAIESSPQRLSVPRMAEYIRHGDRAGLEVHVDQVAAFFSQFPEAGPSEVPGLLDAEIVKVFEDAAA